MTTNIVNQVAYLRTTREFPTEITQLGVETNKAYLDTAQAVNNRTIGIFSTNQAAITGETWFVSKNQRQQGFRQVYAFADGNLTIVHGLKLTGITNFVRIWGTFFDGTNWWPLPYVDVVNANNQINVKIDETNITITKGGGAPPAINNGLVILEWISNP